MLTRPSFCLTSRFASLRSSICNHIPKHRLAPTARSSSHSPQGKQHLAPEITTKQDLKIFTYSPNSQFHTNFHDFAPAHASTFCQGQDSQQVYGCPRSLCAGFCSTIPSSRESMPHLTLYCLPPLAEHEMTHSFKCFSLFPPSFLGCKSHCEAPPSVSNQSAK